MIEIENLVQRIPGIDEDEGRMIASMVAQTLAEYEMPIKENRVIDHLPLAVKVRERIGRNELVGMISRQIYSHLNPMEEKE